MRVLMSVLKRHRAYGEAIAEAIGALRPHLKVSVAPPEAFEEELRHLSPELVVCNRPCGAWRDARMGRVLVDADGAATFRVGGRRRELTRSSVIGLLAIVDEAWTLARSMPMVA